MAGTVETRVVIDANAKNAIRALEELDTAAGDTDKTLTELDGSTVDVDTSASVDGMDELRRAGDDAVAAIKAMSDTDVRISADTSGIATAAGDVDALQADAGTPITIDIDVDADKLNTVKSKLDDVGDSGRAGGTAIGGIGNAVSELPGVGALGPIAESIGQLTENALEGGESLRGMGKAVGVLGGTALVMYGIQRAMQSIADTKAFNTAQTESFTEALKEAESAAQAMLTVLKEAGGVEGRAGGFGPLFEGTKDITANLVDAKVSADEFILAVTEGGPALDTVVGKLVVMRDAAREAFEQSLSEEDRAKMLEYNDAIEIVNETLKNNKAATDDNVVSNDFLKGALEDSAGAAHEASDKTKDLAGAYDAARRKADDLTYANALLRGDIDKRDAYLRLQDQFDDLKTKGSEAWDAAATGADDAESKMREYEIAQGDAKIAVMDFNDEWGAVDLDKTIALNTNIDRGEFDTVMGDIDSATRGSKVIDVRIRTTVDQAWNNVMNIIPGSGRITG